MKSFGKGDKLSKIELMNALTKSGVFLSLVQLSTLIRTFDVDGTQQLSLSAFADALQGRFSKRRKAILTKIFNSVDTNGNGKVEFKELMARFKADGHPSVEASLVSKEVIEDRMNLIFEGAQKLGYLTLDDFLQFYAKMNATIPANDDLFCEIVSGVWGVPETEKKISRRDNPKVRTMLNILKEKVRQKSSSHRGNVKLTLCKWFKFFDKSKKESVTYNEWNQTLERLGVVVEKEISQEVFSCFAGESDKLEYQKFVSWLFSEPDFQATLDAGEKPKRRLIS
eukprot:CAMPEP_0184505428 /NCGR_PEP_ID=MMETSP0113_2-20130426/52981_1 /TAXON_ID=91329 /ORGANISM="Norrisiella sphaerica, Strain BC52" /LENGTH=281 /DNA_ID=CAMNT_0026895117 /DNA_START=36 /DNA_END=881 /DNA_ORIENTATION=-